MTDLGTTPRSFLSLTKTYKVLTKVQSASAIVFSTFTAVHGAQLVAANIGGPDLANHWIMVGRPIYQDEHLEGILVTGSAIAHVLAGLAKMGIRIYWNRNQKISNALQQQPNVLRYHGLTGYLLIPLAGLHYYLVRVLPMNYYGDSSFIDFGYVAWGLQNKPIFSYGLHTALIVAAAYHIVGGTKYLFGKKNKAIAAISSPPSTKVSQHSKAADRKLQKSSHWIQKSVIAGVSLTLVSSLIIIGRGTKKIPLRLDFAQMYARII